MAGQPVAGSYAVALWWELKGDELVKWGLVQPVEKDAQSFKRTK